VKSFRIRHFLLRSKQLAMLNYKRILKVKCMLKVVLIIAIRRSRVKTKNNKRKNKGNSSKIRIKMRKMKDKMVKLAMD